jgi:RNA polymerase sigma-70 factor (ECF subfamily)
LTFWKEASMRRRGFAIALISAGASGDLALGPAIAGSAGGSTPDGVCSEGVGSPEARLEVLFRRYGPVIYHRCRMILGDAAAAQDATQETFLRVQRHLQKIPEADEALAYIYRIATNYCLNERRNQKHRAEPMAEPPEVSEASFEERVADRHLASHLMARVPAHLRTPAFLHYVDGLDQSEVAKVLNVSRRTVVSRLSEFQSRAKALLRGSQS